MNTPSWNAEHKYDGLFRKFCLWLQNWCRPGKEPSAGDQDIKYYLNPLGKRLWEHGLAMEPEVLSVHEISECMPIQGNGFSRFNRFLYTQQVTRSVTFSREGKGMLRREKFLSMYETILDPDPEDNLCLFQLRLHLQSGGASGRRLSLLRDPVSDEGSVPKGNKFLFHQ